jgi:hypothetical protein
MEVRRRSHDGIFIKERAKNDFVKLITLPLNKYNTYCPLWSSFNGKFKCLNEKSMTLI